MTSDRPTHEPSRDGDAEWHVTRCACGQVTIRLGTVRLKFSREDFALLHRLVQGAMTEFDIAPSARPVHHVRATTH